MSRVIYLYLLLVACALFELPLVILSFGGNPIVAALVALVTTTVLLLLLGYGLAAIPIGRHWDLPPRQRSVVLPILAGATCAGLLVLGVGLASLEFWQLDRGPGHELAFWGVGAGAAVAWLLWVALFAWFARSLDRDSLNDRSYKWLLGGSTLELLVAIPMHIVVRRRGECCGGFLTGIGVGVGLTVMVAALGPALFVLFYRRYKQVYAPRDRPG